MIAKLKWLTAIGSLLLFVALSGCNDDSIDGSLSFSEDNLLLKAAGDTVAVAVTAGSDWEAESQADWCTVEKEGEEKLIVRVSPSDDVYERGTAVKITCGDNVVRLSVRQEPMVFEISDGKKTLDFEKGVATDVLKIRTNMAWKVEIADTTGWLQVADTVGAGDKELVFTVSDNSRKSERATTVRLRYGVRSLKLTATQAGGIGVDGHVLKHYGEREVENGFNLIFLGEGFTEEDLISEIGAFDKAVEEAYEFLFSVEPYKTYQEYFNVYSIACKSKERGVATEEEEPKNTAFRTSYVANSFYAVNTSTAWDYAIKIMGMTEDILKNNTCVVILVNDERYGGNTYWYADGRALSVVPLNRDTELPGGFTNLFLHEVGGHGIGKLGDEWSDDVPLSAETKSFLASRINSKYCWNLGLPTIAALAKYPTYVTPFSAYAASFYSSGKWTGTVEGGYGCVNDSGNKRFVVHSEDFGCMLDHSSCFNVASRYAIVQYVFLKIGEEFTAKSFIDNDTWVIPEEQPVLSDRPRLTMPSWIEVD